MPKGLTYTKEYLDIIIKKIEQYKKNYPEVTRTKIATYSNVDISVLKRLEKEGKLELPKPKIKKTQKRKRIINWAKLLGNFNGR